MHRRWSPTVSILRGGPDGLSPGSELKTIEGGRPVAIQSGDYNGDGFLDLVAAHEETGQVLLLRGGPAGLGKGSLVLEANHPALMLADDFDRDGYPDLAVANNGSSSLSFLKQRYLTPHAHACSVPGSRFASAPPILPTHPWSTRSASTSRPTRNRPTCRSSGGWTSMATGPSRSLTPSLF